MPPTTLSNGQPGLGHVQRNTLITDDNRRVASSVAMDVLGAVGRADDKYIVTHSAVVNVATSATHQPTARRCRGQGVIAATAVQVSDAQLVRIKGFIGGAATRVSGGGGNASGRHYFAAITFRRQRAADGIRQEVDRQGFTSLAVDHKGTARNHAVTLSKIATNRCSRYVDLSDAELGQGLEFARIAFTIVRRINPNPQLAPYVILLINHLIRVAVDTGQRRETLCI
ncbi:hypothetical protein D3C84_479830 [compost metagenome]